MAYVTVTTSIDPVVSSVSGIKLATKEAKRFVEKTPIKYVHMISCLFFS